MRQIVFDQRDKTGGKITWQIEPFASIDGQKESAARFGERRFLRGECTGLETPQPHDFVMEDSFVYRLQGLDFVVGEPAPLVPQPAAVAKDLALARTIQTEMDKDNLTYREVGPKHGFSRATVGRLVPLVRLAPDIQEVVSRLTTTTASERIDRQTLEWVAEPLNWSDQRTRFQEVMNKYYAPEPARIAKTLTEALELRKEVEEKNLTIAKAARRGGQKPDRIRSILALTDLAPDIQTHLLAMTTTTVSLNVSEPKLRLVAQEPTHADQRRLYERLLAGQLRSTRKEHVVTPPPPTEEERVQSLVAIKARVAESTKRVEDAVMSFTEPFALKQVCEACPNASVSFVRRALQMLRAEGRVTCDGIGWKARWRKIG